MNKILIKNGLIYTLDEQFRVYKKMLIENGTIISFDEKIDNSTINGDFEVIDLDGRIVLPAFHDSHVHLLGVGKSRIELDLFEIESINSLKERLLEKIVSLPFGNWIFGSGWKKDLWQENRFPTRFDIDPVSQNNPVAIYSKDRHTLLLNSKAIENLRITKDSDFDGYGEIVCDAHGNPTGMLKEDACKLLTYKVDDFYDLSTLLNEAFTSFLKNGITSIDIMEDSKNCIDVLTLLRKLEQFNTLPLNINVYFPTSMIDELISDETNRIFKGQNLHFGGIKIFADGALGSQTAHMIDPYEGSYNNRGISTIEQDELDDLVKKCNMNNMGCAVHAIGNMAVRKALNSFESVSYLTDNTNIMNRIEHFQIIHPDDVPRLNQIRFIASMQPIHISGDIDIAQKYWGDKCNFAYPYRTLFDTGIPVIMGSDAPIEDMNPLKGIYSAITRKKLNSKNRKPFYPNQRILLYEALKAYITTPHIFFGKGNVLGSLKEGKQADLVLLSEDIFKVKNEKLPDIKIEMTLSKGHIYKNR
jgi:predicted amidohydrolase YtcJ